MTTMLTEINSASITAPIKELLSYATSRVEIEYKNYMVEPNRKLYGMYAKDVLVGCVGIEKISERTCEVKHIAVFPKERRNKIASTMLEFLLENCSFNTLVAETDQDAVNFYRTFGFHITTLGEKYPGVERFKCHYFKK